MSGMTTLTALVEKVYDEAVRPLAPAEQRRLAEHILAKCQEASAAEWRPVRQEGTTSDEDLIARLARAFPGLRPATKTLSGIEADFTPTTIPAGVDLVAMLIEDRQDRDDVP